MAACINTRVHLATCILYTRPNGRVMTTCIYYTCPKYTWPTVFNQIYIKKRVKHLFSFWVLETLFFSLWVSICITDDTSVFGNDRISISVNFSVQNLTDPLGRSGVAEPPHFIIIFLYICIMTHFIQYAYKSLYFSFYTLCINLTIYMHNDAYIS